MTTSPAIAADPSELVVVIEHARALLDASDVERALKLSSVAYDQAKAAAGSAERVKASRELVDKARQMQADALEIESMCYIAMADAVDQAQASGKLSRGRPEKVQGSDLFSLEDVGIDKRRLHEARKLRDAERETPGIVKKVIQARLDAGLEPSRANLRAAVGTASATKDERGDNFYQTPEVATRMLLAFESFSGTIWEPACGHGAISKVLEEAGYETVLSDLVDRGAANQHGELQTVGDFLLSAASPVETPDIVTNPPYGEVLNDFVAHALRVHRPRKMALLLNLNFLCGFADEARNFVMDENPPARVYVFKRRLPMMHREGWDGKKASSRMNTAWFVWELQPDGTYGDNTSVRRVDWAEFAQSEAVAPGEGIHVAPLAFSEEDFTRQTPRKTVDERVEEEIHRAILWLSEMRPFDTVMLRRGIGVRDSVAVALITAMAEHGLIRQDDDGMWFPTAEGISLTANANAAEMVKAWQAGKAVVA